MARRVALSVLTLFAVSLLPGCTAARRNHHLYSRVQNYVYDRPLEDVWPMVRMHMAEHGYSVKDADFNGLMVLVTEWKEDMVTSEIAATWSRYLVEGGKMDPTHCYIRFYRSVKTAGGNAVVHGSSFVPANNYLGMPPGMELTIEDLGATPSAFWRQTLSTPLVRIAAGQGHAGRDIEMEWQFFRRVEPRRAWQMARDFDEENAL